MATFYLLPERTELARRWTEYLRQWLPGLADPGPELADHLAEFALRLPGGVYIVFADDLPDGDAGEVLRDGFGLEPGDRVFDLRSGPMPALAAWARGPADLFAASATGY